MTPDVVEIVGAGEALVRELGEMGVQVELLPDRLYAYTDRGQEVHRLVTERYSVEQCLLRRGTLEVTVESLRAELIRA